MTYDELRELFRDSLNRTDVTDQQVDMFIDLGTARLHRRLRASFDQETVDLLPVYLDRFELPKDLLSFVSVRDAVGIIPRGGSLSEGERGYRVENDHIITPHKPTTITVTYFRAAPKPGSPDQATEQSTAIPDVILYSALLYAAIHFVDERTASFSEMFETLVHEVQNMTDELAMSGHPQISNPYEGVV